MLIDFGVSSNLRTSLFVEIINNFDDFFPAAQVLVKKHYPTFDLVAKFTHGFTQIFRITIIFFPLTPTSKWQLVLLSSCCMRLWGTLSPWKLSLAKLFVEICGTARTRGIATWRSAWELLGNSKKIDNGCILRGAHIKISVLMKELS